MQVQHWSQLFLSKESIVNVFSVFQDQAAKYAVFFFNNENKSHKKMAIYRDNFFI